MQNVDAAQAGTLMILRKLKNQVTPEGMKAETEALNEKAQA